MLLEEKNLTTELSNLMGLNLHAKQNVLKVIINHVHIGIAVFQTHAYKDKTQAFWAGLGIMLSGLHCEYIQCNETSFELSIFWFRHIGVNCTASKLGKVGVMTPNSHC